MRRLGTLLLAIGAVISAMPAIGHAESVLTRHVRQETVNGEARPLGRLPATQTMRLVFVLPLRNQAELNNFLHDVYNPDSASYRHFLSVEEFTAEFGPTQEDYDAVIGFAKANGLAVVGTSRNRLNVDVSGPVASIERALHLSLGPYQHPTENRTFYAPDREPTHRSSVPTVARRGAGQLFDSASCRPVQKAGRAVERHYRLRAFGLLFGQRHAGGILRWNGSHRQRPVARVAGVLRHRPGRSDHVFQECRSNQQRPYQTALYGWHQHQLPGFTRL